MSSSSNKQANVTLAKGNILNSKAHAIVNTVNCVGVMGKGVALLFKRKYPEMFKDYVRKCDRKEVALGAPYPYFEEDHVIVNFPTKQHWRSVSRLQDIEDGLIYLRDHIASWGIKSIALPPLGCGNGQLDWNVVRPVLLKHLESFPVKVELYVPLDVELDDDQLSFDNLPNANSTAKTSPRIAPSMLALVEILNVVEQDSYHWPVGRVMFQKLAYFATVAGIPTHLTYKAGSYGPFAEELNKSVAVLQNNGLVREQPRGKRIEVSVGDSYRASRDALLEDLEPGWHETIYRVADLVARFDTTQAEVAATVHYSAKALANRHARTPFAREVIDAVEKWKIRRQPPLRRDDIGRSIVSLATQGWISVVADESVELYLDEVNEFC
ncbi:type II toxin-antitoxin system antitoxin DNA ADP-ribosyl glycohydrolase DarG [Actinokineospora pegani]|uniref:type II toxin-antitoxin system antitoxin DNA ADP-ribosyl glycohydrolase DarG n=1 Tax=Actinokineospora pegani TaxID=2654637 RepID=UPI0018D2C7DA|nr:macro domain-containing protein [Actinokineospora pegani]